LAFENKTLVGLLAIIITEMYQVGWKYVFIRRFMPVYQSDTSRFL